MAPVTPEVFLGRGRAAAHTVSFHLRGPSHKAKPEVQTRPQSRACWSSPRAMVATRVPQHTKAVCTCVHSGLQSTGQGMEGGRRMALHTAGSGEVSVSWADDQMMMPQEAASATCAQLPGACTGQWQPFQRAQSWPRWLLPATGWGGQRS